MAPDVGLACLSLVAAPKDRPVQAVGDGVFGLVNEFEESADFGEGERDQASVDGWSGLWFGRRVGWIFLLVSLCGVLAPLFLAWCAVTARKVWVSMARVICRCQAFQVRTW